MHLNYLALPLLAAAFTCGANGAVGEPEMATKRIAIIGAGAGGSSAAYYLDRNAKELGFRANISVFERSSYIGGRSTTVNAWNDRNVPIELGASIFVEVNHILVSAAKTFNLSRSSEDIANIQGLPELGVWNGEKFVLVTSNEDGWWDKAKLLWRYGLAPIRTNSLMKSVVGKFSKMYDEPVFPWRSLSEAVQEVGLTEVTGATGEQFLKNNGIGEKFANEIIQASTRVNYAQNLPLIHGVETMVCMATNGAMSIKGGNWKIFARMLNASATTHLNTSVASISKQADKTYRLTTSSGETSTFDTVILAAPLQFSKLTIDPLAKRMPDHIPYVKLHVTLFASPHKLDPAAFNMEVGKQVPQYVLTTLPPNESHGSDPNGVGSPGFFSISIVGSGLNPHSSPPNRPEYIYKIFSPARINSTFLSKVIGQDVPDALGSSDGPVSWIYHKIWHSYPYEYPRVTFDDIKLDEGLWYTSGMEAFISTMETSALMGKNVARLIVDEWQSSWSNSASKPEAKEEEQIQKPHKDGETLQVQKDDWEFTGLKGSEQKPIKAKL
ncbi:prenylcysteine oxidase-like protein 1 precursor [Melanomma pulvis-pyrius CBS 109.77]|uniref:Prenylcysteine oxidase-like protein 1 n=1 Tax=Melanomma pulvis-pyrius CBS 109.77 TaxID=1314802 RepID=A0A6A6XPG5_9PLEO|nr:prenylcysteine oxidase-like protein 1 precursor [Melanomma pulvis-pyrius CBS 109.77]